jgi:hypothetical protein
MSNPVNKRCRSATMDVGCTLEEMSVKPLMSQNRMDTPSTKSDTHDRP